jgi:hypothetical protein
MLHSERFRAMRVSECLKGHSWGGYTVGGNWIQQAPEGFA